MDATLVCWSCKAERHIEVAGPPMFAFDVAGWAQDVGWKGVMDLKHGRSVVFCGDECLAYQTTKNGTLRARAKPMPNAQAEARR